MDREKNGEIDREEWRGRGVAVTRTTASMTLFWDSIVNRSASTVKPDAPSVAKRS